MSLSKNINPSLVLVQPRKTRPFITERLLMGRKESNQIKNQMNPYLFAYWVILHAFILSNKLLLGVGSGGGGGGGEG